MNKIVREHYPASNLPADLRGEIDPATRVTVTVVEESATDRAISLQEIFSARRPPYRSREEIVADLRRLRDEWDD